MHARSVRLALFLAVLVSAPMLAAPARAAEGSALFEDLELK